ncbi:MAG: DUF962 domain-containing protein [Hellea sp.]
MSDINTFRDYWPEYLREHSRPATRMSHYLHTGVGGVAILFAIATQRWIMLLGVLGVIFCSALFSHLVFEKNKPAAATHPFWWSVLNDIRMLMHFLTGTLKAELEKAAL